MIERLRRAHRRVWIALLLVLPLIGLLALGVHHPPALERALPASLSTEAAGAAAAGALTLAWEGDRLLARRSRSGEPVPNALLYLEIDRPVSGSSLSPGARLLGRLVAGRPLDAGTPPPAAQLALYSLAWDSVLVRLPVPERP